MVYKKITNNIPSLSSLFLAGMVLGGCTDKPPEKAASTTEAAPTSPNESSYTPAQIKAGWGAWSAIFNNVDVKFQYFVSVPKLESVKPDTYKGKDGKNTEARNSLQKRVAMIRNAFPDNTSAKQALDALYTEIGNANSPINTVSYVQLSDAIEQIANAWNGFHEVYTGIHKVNDKLNGSENIQYYSWTEELNRLNTLHTSMKFTPEFCFMLDRTKFMSANRKKAELPASKDHGLLLFLEEEADKHGVKEIMGSNIGGVLIAPSPSSQVGEDINKPGSAIDVKNDKNPNFTIDGIEQSDALTVCDLSFKSILFNLFRGDYDTKKVNNGIFAVNQQKDRDIKLKANDEAFQALVEAAEETKSGQNEAFANYIGNLTTKGKPLFAIADHSKLQEEILDIVRPKQGSQAPNENGSGDDLGSGSFTETLVDTIVGKLQSDSLEDVRSISEGSCKNFLELACVRIAKWLLSDSIKRKFFSNDANTANASACFNDLKDKLKSITEDAILRKTGNSVYESTPLTTLVMEKVIEMNKMLRQRKNAVDGLTYGDIKQKVAGFEIQNINSWFEDTYKCFRSLLSIPDKLRLIMCKEGQVNYRQELGADSDVLNDDIISKLEELRLKCTPNNQNKDENEGGDGNEDQDALSKPASV